MPQLHSAFYNKVTDNHSHIDSLALQKIIREASLSTSADGNSIYDQLVDLLRENSDAQFGIVSRLNDKGEWVRDATASLPLESRPSHDSSTIEANNALMRCLSRLRSIDYAISQKHPDEFGQDLRGQMQEHLAKLCGKMLDTAQANISEKGKKKAIEHEEKAFDTLLLEALHTANLTKGCQNENDGKKLLNRYRILSSLTLPARTMVTLTYDADKHVFQRETQYPITEKTAFQKDYLKSLKELNPCASTADKNAHTMHSLAHQEADSLFADLMMDDTRALPAQARKLYLATARNAFLVKNELFFDTKSENMLEVMNQDASEENTLWLARTGVPVYVGKNEDKAAIQQHTRENTEQIRIMAEKFGLPVNLHFTTLNTYSPYEQQTTMLDHLYDATRNNAEKNDDISYVPVNLEGTLRPIEIAPSLSFDEHEHRPSGIAPFAKATRALSAARILLKACATKTFLSVINCASAQDRTGTIVEKATQLWMGERYDAHVLETDSIQAMRARGGNAAEITSHLMNGSRGMKTVSKAGDTFDELSSKEFYLASADTNKNNPVSSAPWLTQLSEKAVGEFVREQLRFEDVLEATKNNPEKQQMYQRGKALLNGINEITKADSDKAVSATDLADLTSILKHSTQAIINPEDSKNIRTLAGLSKRAASKDSTLWNKIAFGIASLACLAMVAAGVLFAAPTGGLSLMLSAAGVTGLKLSADTYSGACAQQSYRKLSHSLTLFKSYAADGGSSEEERGFSPLVVK